MIKLKIKEDPRKNRYSFLEGANIKTLEDFYKNSIQPKTKLLSIVGDSKKIDLDELRKIGPLTVIKADQLFTR